MPTTAMSTAKPFLHKKTPVQIRRDIDTDRNRGEQSRANQWDLRDYVKRLFIRTSQPHRPDFSTLVEPSYSRLVRLVRMTGNGPVILPCGRERLQGEPLCSLVDEIPNSVLLVR